MKPLSRNALVVFGSAAAVLLSSCGGAAIATPPSTSRADGADAAALVRSAFAATRAVESAHFTLTTSGSLDRQQVLSADGDVVVRPKTAARGTATVRANGIKTSSFVLVGDTMYADIDKAGFVAHRAGTSFYDVGALFDPADGIPDILQNLRGAKIAGEDDVAGTAATRVTGTADASDIAELAGIRATHGSRSPQAPVTIWIQKSAPHNVLRIAGAPKDRTEVQITLSAWGIRPVITAPPTLRAAPSGHPSTPAGVSVKPAK